MKNFSKWLSDNPGKAKLLGEELGVGRSSISNVKCGRRPMPTHWMEIVHRVSGRKLSLRAMLEDRASVIKNPTKRPA